MWLCSLLHGSIPVSIRVVDISPEFGASSTIVFCTIYIYIVPTNQIKRILIMKDMKQTGKREPASLDYL